ncbi:MAG: hypothetical protein IJF83_11080 [Methanobrevibacter sp.]|nr:hypothetical protein [Methanobrevibacter sp.]
MIEEDKTSNYSMSDFYKVMKWIPRSRVDRQEPVEFKEEVSVVGDSVVFPTIHSEFNGIDYVQIFINFGGVHVDVNDVLLDFSPLANGNISLLQAKCNDSEITENADTIITFQLDDNVTFTDQTREITGVESIKLSFGTDVTGAKITNLIMRSGNYTYTLSDIENFLITGKNHVLRKLGHYAKHRKVPKELMSFVYMAGGAYAWLSRWEYETKPMKESKAEADNYATRLLNQVDSAIANYISDIENKFDHKDLFHATSQGIEWGL